MALLKQDAKTITEASLLALGEDASVEVVNGEVIHMPPGGMRHARIGARIAQVLLNYVNGKGLGEVFQDQVGYVLKGSPGDVRLMRVPDVSFVAKAKLPDEDKSGFCYCAPDLAVEVISPSERFSDILRKVTDYLEAGSQIVWVVYPEAREVVVYTPGGAVTLKEDDLLDGGAALPGFSVVVSALFKRSA